MRAKKWILRTAAIFGALIFLISMLMTETYSWQNGQAIVNHVYGTKTTMTPVELLKLEKLSDGTETENPVAGAAFYLFSKNGEQIGEQYVTDANGKIAVSLNPGDYYFEEVKPGIGYTYDTNLLGKPVTKYPFSVIEEDKKIEVKVYNLRRDGDLLIHKQVINGDGTPLTEEQQMMDFAFTVEFSDEGTYTYRIDDGKEQPLASGGTLKLRDGQTASFEDLPEGVLYQVTEVPVSGYTVTGTGHQGNITEAQQSIAEFVNCYDPRELGSLTVSKEVEGEGADLEKKFMFIARIGDKTERFTLKHGQAKTFADLPVGTSYEVTEQADMTKKYSAKVSHYAGTITSAESVVLPFVNIYNETPAQDKFGALRITKTVIGENPYPDKKFTFTVVFAGKHAPPAETFTLKDGEEKIFEPIPDGVTYTVTETDSAGYEPVLEFSSGLIIKDQEAVVAFTNNAPPQTEETVILSIKKVLAGEYLESAAEKRFEMTLTVDGNQTSFTLKDGEIREFQLPVGAEYAVSEKNYLQDGFAQSITNGSGVAADQDIEVIVTNTYIAETQIEISGQKSWDFQGCEDVALPAAIIVSLKNGDTLVEKQVVKPDKKNQWHYKFTAPKHNEDGSLAEYTVEEEPVSGFRASYDGYNITNTYVKPVVVEMPVIKKVIKGENPLESDFTFVFSGQHGTPMPEGADGYKKHLTLRGAGEVSIGKITFDRAGTYIYNVYEKNRGDINWDYDAAKYTITVVVSEGKKGLRAELTMTKNNDETEALVFTNIFDAKLDEMVTISGEKKWNHGSNPEGARPASVTVKVYADGNLIAQKEISKGDNWKYAFTLPRFAEDGHEIVYTVDEEDVEGYRKAVKGYNITNTFVSETKVPDEDIPPETGDRQNLFMWAALLMMSVFALGRWMKENE